MSLCKSVVARMIQEDILTVCVYETFDEGGYINSHVGIHQNSKSSIMKKRIIEKFYKIEKLI